jgi:hypothetical protein
VEHRRSGGAPTTYDQRNYNSASNRGKRCDQASDSHCSSDKEVVLRFGPLGFEQIRRVVFSIIFGNAVTIPQPRVITRLLR